jgi:hypothetical protein
MVRADAIDHGPRLVPEEVFDRKITMLPNGDLPKTVTKGDRKSFEEADEIAWTVSEYELITADEYILSLVPQLPANVLELVDL